MDAPVLIPQNAPSPLRIPPAKTLLQMKKIQPLIDEVKKVDGIFMSLWHNDTLNNRKIWLGWKAVYENMVQYATADKN